MARIWKYYSLSFKKDRLRKSHGDTQRQVNRDDALSRLSTLEEHVGWNYNGVVTGISFRMRGDVWKALLKMEIQAGPKVAYFTGTSLRELVENVHWYCSARAVCWEHDKLPVRVSYRKGESKKYRLM